jgi:heat shock protein beta
VLAQAADDVASTMVPPEGAEKYAFEAEVHRMMDIVVNSLYQNKDVFLRELISNASDALDKFRYLALTEPDTYKGEEEIPLQVKIQYDADEHTLTIRDTGVGMTHDEMVENLGTVARSGTTKFIQSLKESGNDDSAMSQIGQFGVGFYSTFLVADRVTVASKNPRDDAQHVWESENASSSFVVYPDPRGNTLGRGTEITLHLKEDSLEYADPNRLRELAQHYSEFVMHPISLRTTSTMEVEIEDEEEEATPETTEEAKETKGDDGDDEIEVGDDESETEEKPKKTKEVTTHSWDVLNTNQAIWTREKEDISDDEYQAFWQVLAHEATSNATSWSHFNAEGNINFKSILYLPDDLPPTYSYTNMEPVQGALRLYVRKVLIGDEFNLLPKYLGFIRGVVDSDDLPLNVNRETLQESKILSVIKKKLVRKAIEMIRQLAKDSEDEGQSEAEIDEEGNVIETEEKDSRYIEFYRKFSPNIKLGVVEDEPNRGKLMKLLRFQTSKSDGKMISLAAYFDNMKEWQEEIYVLGGASAEEIEKSPFLETFRDKDVEVIYLTDSIDEYMLRQVRDHEKKKFVQISSESVKFKDEDEDLIKRREKAYKNTFKPLTKWLRKLYTGSILRVQVARRSLGSVPAIVTSSDFGNSANMERILRAQAFQHGMDQSSFLALKVFELNPRHPLVKKLLDGCPPEEEGDEPFEVAPDILDAAWMLHDMAMLNGGFPISDPEAHNQRLLKVLRAQFSLDSLDLEPEIDPPVEEDEAPEIDFTSDGINMEDFDLDSLNLDDLDMGA